MSEILVARWRESRIEWIPMDTRGGRLGPVQVGDATELLANLGSRRLIFVVPGEDVLVTEVDIPVKGAGKVLKAVPFAMEEQLVGDVDTQHFAIGRKTGGGHYGVAIVDQQKMGEWLERLSAQGIDPDELVPESLGIPLQDGQTTLLISGGSVAIRGGAWDATCLGALSLDEASDCFIVEDEQTLAIYCDARDYETQRLQVEALRESHEDATLQLLEDGGLPVLAGQIIRGDRISLLQGKYARRSRIGEKFKPWKLAASLLLAFVVTMIARDLIEMQQLKKLALEQRQEMAAVLQSVCPQETRAVQPLNQLRICTNSGNADDGQHFLLALEMLSDALPANAQASLISINYASQTLELRISVPDVATLDGIQRKVSDTPGYQAEIQSATRVEDATEGRITIRLDEGSA